MKFPQTGRLCLTLPALAAGLCLQAGAQVANPTTIAPGVRSAEVIQDQNGELTIYNIKPVQRTLDAVSYFPDFGPTGVTFAGTDLARGITGKAGVEAKAGRTNISLELNHLTPANGYGTEYLTYVLWAISADGRAQNLGELLLHGDKASIRVTTALQSFGIIVTAEPYFAVAQPSDVVVAQAMDTHRTSGVLQKVNTHYSLLPRGLYADTTGAHTVAHPITDHQHTPLAMYEALNAQRIALDAGAGTFAPEITAEVAQDVQNAQTVQTEKRHDLKLELAFARQATQRAEDSRISTLHKQAAERERLALQAAIDAQVQADAARVAQMQADQQRDQAELAAARALAAANQANQNAALANESAAASQQDAAAMRERLRKQLNAVLRTSETARGLIVNMNDVLFATNKAALKVNAEISLAKIATILSLYPGLKVQVEGYTDSRGSVALNQRLSDARAHSVEHFLTANGVPAENVTARGFGESDPVATNATAAGRQQNRRVNLVVSGSAIGVHGSSPSNETPQ